MEKHTILIETIQRQQDYKGWLAKNYTDWAKATHDNTPPPIFLDPSPSDGDNF